MDRNKHSPERMRYYKFFTTCRTTDRRRTDVIVVCWMPKFDGLKAVVNTVCRRFVGLEACFLLVTVVVVLFLFDKFGLKHLLKAVVNRKYPHIPVFHHFS